MMDVLKYYFGIDLAKSKSKKCERHKFKKKRKCQPVLQRFVYVIDVSHLNQLTKTVSNNNKNF